MDVRDVILSVGLGVVLFVVTVVLAFVLWALAG